MPFGLKKNSGRRELAEQNNNEPVGWLGPGVEIEGKITFGTGMLCVNTSYKGGISCDGTVVVEDQGEVEAEIHTRVITIAGKVKGTVHASERIEIKEHGLVLGNIFTPCLVIDPGGFFDGQCHMPTPEPQPQSSESLGAKLHS